MSKKSNSIKISSITFYALIHRGIVSNKNTKRRYVARQLVKRLIILPEIAHTDYLSAFFRAVFLYLSSFRVSAGITLIILFTVIFTCFSDVVFTILDTTYWITLKQYKKQICLS